MAPMESTTSPLPVLSRPVRVVTATSLFDGHDAAIQMVRRLLQSAGAEVIHLGHDRSADAVAEAALQEDADAVAVSSYQGGHMEYFPFLVDRLRDLGAPHVKVFAGGGGTITETEARELVRQGVTAVYSVEDGRRLGPQGMIRDLLGRCQPLVDRRDLPMPPFPRSDDPASVARALSCIEHLHEARDPRLETVRGLLQGMAGPRPPVLGLTGTGGAGKSSLLDEVLIRMGHHFPDRRVAVLAVDPSRRRSGGALLGDRLRFTSASLPRVFVRSVATRRAHLATAEEVPDLLRVLQAAGHDLVVLETAGIGQGSSEVVDLCDLSLYVMTPDFGAPSQLEKIDMLDLADLVALNKADHRGSADALREVRRQVRRNREAFDLPEEALPVFATQASRFGDDGVDALFGALCDLLQQKTGREWSPGPPPPKPVFVPVGVPPERERYLSEIAATCRLWRATVEAQAAEAARADGIRRTLLDLGLDPDGPDEAVATADPTVLDLRRRYREALDRMRPDLRQSLQDFDRESRRHAQDEVTYSVRGQEIRVPATSRTLSGTVVPKVIWPRMRDWGERVRFLGLVNVPGRFPFTAGAFPFKRTHENPTRMFAGEGLPERTNRRFHFLSQGQPAVRLSTAFDSPTLYGEDPDPRPDILGKVGNSGVSVATADDARRLYSGFDLLAPTTSVSMTINGPAPMMLAFFFRTAIDQAVERLLRDRGRLEEARQAARRRFGDDPPVYRGDLPEGHDGTGLALLGTRAEDLLDPAELAEVRSRVLRLVRGTIQADILKEDQAQNTCIFRTDFALRLMGDIQDFFLREQVRNFYSVSISGYHIAEAGANPITQLAFTLANGFTYLEAWRARGMAVDDFAPNLSFFFSNGMEAEYAVIGRVARRIWAVALRDLYGAGERAQQLKYHIQTSGRSLHAQEVAFNDIRTTLQALYAVFDNCQSLHTNAYDEAVTTPTEESVRRALAIQRILQQEFGLSRNENPWQGSDFVEWLTDQVEEAVLREFDRLSERGGVLGAMETRYQRNRIQDESLEYEEKKHSGALPIVGVNTFLDPHREATVSQVPALVRASPGEQQAQVEQVRRFQEAWAPEAAAALDRLRQDALAGRNLFEALLEAAGCCTLGQMTHALYQAGGRYRRNL
ncbi:MAG TPA: methylmalonyl-CoA mutase family protein [Myxococcota bacterium]|nr:methylmalonyl-CoA mutase family protein [Myxococcota bacterium]HQK50149.1 methylmalonyl-CoA mutase family protein [Myxococcota bacterium]